MQAIQAIINVRVSVNNVNVIMQDVYTRQS